MKKLIATCVALMFAVGAAGFAAAQDKKADEKKPEMKSDMKSDAKMDKKEKKAAAKTASGSVKSASADSLVVGGKMKGKDEEWTFGVDSKTSIKRGGKSITAADLKAGDSVQVRYTEDAGKMMAQSVTVRGGAAKKAEKMDKTDKMDKMESKPAEKK